LRLAARDLARMSKSARPDDEIATAGQMQVLHEGTAALLLPQIIANAMLKQIIKVAVLNDTTTSACSPNLSKSRSIQGLRGDLDFVHSQSAARAGPPQYSAAGTRGPDENAFHQTASRGTSARTQRLTFLSNQARGMTRKQNIPWTAEEERRLIAMKAAGRSIISIAAALHRTRGAIHARSRELQAQAKEKTKFDGESDA
jgi:hypothetical protein